MLKNKISILVVDDDEIIFTATRQSFEPIIIDRSDIKYMLSENDLQETELNIDHAGIIEELDEAESQLGELATSLAALAGRPGVDEAAVIQARKLVGLLEGELYVARSEYQKAIQSLQPLFDQSLPDDSSGYTHRVALSLARGFMGLSMFELAEPCLERAIGEQPDDPLSNLLASELQKRHATPDRAIE